MVDTPKQTRDDIREQIKQQRKALNNTALETAGENLLDNCKRFIVSAKSIAGYQSMMGEIPLHAVFDYCHQHDITTLLPIMRDKSLMFAPFNATTTFSVKQYGIREPDVPENDWLSPDQLELVLVPLVAFDYHCNRIGMGGGFYDRSFAFRKNQAAPPTLVGVAHAFQQVEDAFAQTWDVRMDYIATDAGLHTHSLQ